MNKYLIKLANHLDQKGLHKEADYVDWILKKYSSNDFYILSDELNPLDINIDGEMKEVSIKSIFLEPEDDAEGVMEYEINGVEHSWEFLSGFYNEGAAWNIIEALGLQGDTDKRTDLEEEIIEWINTQIIVNPNRDRTGEKEGLAWFYGLKNKYKRE